MFLPPLFVLFLSSNLFIIWGVLLLFSWKMISLLKEKSKGFFFLLIQEMVTLGFLLAAIMGWEVIMLLMLLIKMALPPFHGWVLPLLFQSSKKWFISFLSIYKVPSLWLILLLGSEGSGMLVVLSAVWMMSIKEIQLLLLFSSGVLLLFSIFIKESMYSLLLFLLLYLFYFWEMRGSEEGSGENYLLYLLFVLGIPPSLHFFFKIYLLSSSGGSGILTLFILLSFSFMIYSYYSYFVGGIMKWESVLPLFKSKGFLMISLLSILFAF